MGHELETSGISRNLACALAPGGGKHLLTLIVMSRKLRM